jgi:MSHA pilin protein MshD
MRTASLPSKRRRASSTSRGARRAGAGFGLIEAILFLVIVGVAVTGLVRVLGQYTRQSADPLVRKQALAVAESLLEEILPRDFANPSGGFTGAATQANRALFDDVSDYNGFATSGVYALGSATPVTGLENYAVQVAVGAPAAAFPGVPAGDALEVTVTVATPSGEAHGLTGYRFRYQ